MTRIDKGLYKEMKTAGQIFEGMIPKLDTAFEALDQGVMRVHLGEVDILSNNTIKHTTLCL